LVEQYNDVKQQAEGYLTGLSQLRDMVANPNAERLLQLGGKVLEKQIKLPPEVERFRDSIRKQIPLEAAITATLFDQVGLGREFTIVQQVIASKADWTKELLRDDVARHLLVNHRGDIVRLARIMLEFTATASRDRDLRRGVVRSLFALWPNRLFETMPPELKMFLQQELGEGATPMFTSRSAKKLSALMSTLAVEETDNQIIVFIKGQPIGIGPLRQMLWDVRSATFDVPEDYALNKLQEFVIDATASSTDVREFVLANLSTLDIQELSTNIVRKTPALNNALSVALTKTLSKEARERIASSVTTMEIGQIISRSVAAEALSKIPGGNVLQKMKNPDWEHAFKDAATRQLAQAALDAALPGLGAVGLAVSDYLGAVAAFDEQMRRVRYLDDEIARLSEMAIQEATNLNDAVRTLGTVRAAVERDGLYREAAVQQLEDLAGAERAPADANDFERYLVQRRGPLAFYLAEKLRQEFDAFERSLATWVSGRSSFRSVLKDLVLRDPNYVRLVLDKDIHLFRWLDRSGERQRGSPDEIYSHWRQLYRLATDVCRDYGCLPGNTVLGSYGQTRPISIGQLVTTDEWERFGAWAKELSRLPKVLSHIN
jgi:hypothetical protein